MLSLIYGFFQSLFWPLSILGLILLTNAGRKLYVVILGIYYLIMSEDKKFQLPSYDAKKDIEEKTIIKQHKKTLLLIRHAESTWNEVFNRGITWKFPLNFIYAIIRESMLFVTSDSTIFDSPLSELGISQSENIAKFIRNYYKNNAREPLENVDQSTNTTDNKKKIHKYISILEGTYKGPIVIVSSPLRRCIETLTLGLFDRLNNSSDKNEKIYLVSTLQENTRNLDGMSLSSTNEKPPLSLPMRLLENSYNVDFEEWFEEKLDTTFKVGYKCPIKRGDERIRQFVTWLFQSNVTIDSDIVIMAGHSLWIRYFFQTYLPKSFQFDGKTQKMTNGGIIACEFSKYEFSDGTTRCLIDPQSLEIIHGGFEKSTSKLKKI